MANKFFNDMTKGGGRGMIAPKRTGNAKPGLNEKAGPAGGLPGKSQPRDRSGGTPKIKSHPKREGL